jgi:GST-like protein
MHEITLDLYTWRTPNGRKPAILLAELGIPYNLHLVDIGQGEQDRPSYLELNPNGKIPALVDRDPQLGRIVVFESGAVLQYLAEKHGRFCPMALGESRCEVFSWLFWQVGGPGPTFGQVEHFASESVDNQAVVHFKNEAKRLAHVLDRRLVDRPFIADSYSIADIACYPWFETVASRVPEIVEDCPNLRAWLQRIGARPAVREGMALKAHGVAHAA